MLIFGEKKSAAEIRGRKIGFLFALMIFISILTFILYRFKVIFLTWNEYFIMLALVILIYIFILVVKRKKRGKGERKNG